MRDTVTAGLLGRDKATTRLDGAPTDSSLAAGAGATLATALLVFILYRPGPRVCRLLRARTSPRLSRSLTQNEKVSLVLRGVVLGGEGVLHYVGLDISVVLFF